MSRLKWDETGKRIYETGLDRGVLFVMGSNNIYSKGVPWNGLTAITESPSGAEANPLYADNIKYLNLIAAEDFGATIEAFAYPDEFAACDGTATVIPGLMLGQQSRKLFGMAYRTKLGNDIAGIEYGYKIHLIYGALVTPTERGYQTVNDSPEAINFSWTVNTTPIDVPGLKPTAHLVIDSRKTGSEVMALLEDLIYGKDFVPGTTEVDPVDAIEPTLPSPTAVLHLIDTGTPYEEVDEMLLDDAGEQILDDTDEEIQVRHMVIVA